MRITQEIRFKIEAVATIIDYGFFCDPEPDQREILGAQAFFLIYKDILNYNDLQMYELTDNKFEMIEEVTKELQLENMYSKPNLIKCITQYIKNMVWDKNFKMWHPKWI